MYINKIPEPKPQLWVVDGNNVVSGSAKVKDYNSDTVNTLDVSYDDDKHTITITDEYLINRFGVVEAMTKAEKIVTDYSGDGELGGDGTDQQQDGSTQSQSIWTSIASILQKYY